MFIESIKKNKNGIILMLISSVLVCIGQLFWKLSVDNGILYMMIGFILYGVGALVMLVAYKFGSLSVLHPVLSLNYIFAILIGSLILNETITPLKIIGIIVITTGVLLIGGGDN